MFFGNVLDQLSSAALLDLTTLESIAVDVDAKVEQLQEWYVNSVIHFSYRTLKLSSVLLFGCFLICLYIVYDKC